MINMAMLKERGVVPRVHGNGFIQVDLTPETRLHVWGDKRIPRQNVYTPIHDHVFSFRSTIIVGRLYNVVLGFSENSFGDYRIYRAEVRKGEDTILKATTARGNVYPIRADLVEYGGHSTTYLMEPFRFHETIVTGPAATIIQKMDLTQAQGNPIKPSVLVRHDQDPDNDFDRNGYDPDLLWRIVERVLKRRHN